MPASQILLLQSNQATGWGSGATCFATRPRMQQTEIEIQSDKPLLPCGDNGEVEPSCLVQPSLSFTSKSHEHFDGHDNQHLLRRKNGSLCAYTASRH